jgi:transposase-like protein
MPSDAVSPSEVTSGTWTTCSSGSTASAMTSDERSIRRATCLGILVQSRRYKRADKRFFRNLLKSLHDAPRVIVTDKLRSYGA